MPRLLNARHEAFANYRAHGCSLEEAYERAGFTRDSGHACRLARRPSVAARVLELRAEAGPGAARANLEQTISGLLSLVERANYQSTPAHLAEARATLMDAHRLHDLWRERCEKERQKLAVSRTKPAISLPVPLPETCPQPAISCPHGDSVGANEI